MDNPRKGEKIVFFDEFSIQNRPTTYYGWGEINTRPEVPSNESQKGERLNGLLAVDAMTGEEFLRLSPTSKTEDIAAYIGELCKDCVKNKVKILTLIMDNNSTHKQKLRNYLRVELIVSGIHEKIKVDFIYTPPYSPNFNLAEYLIHLLRLRLLHHLPIGTSLEEIEVRLQKFFDTQQLQTPIQIANTIKHIYSLII
jgi:transposase